MSRTLFHIGYPKTASTTLQKHVFGQVQGLCFPMPLEAQLAHQMMLHLAGASDDAYNPRACAGLVEDVVARAGGHVATFSCEVLCGQPFRASLATAAASAERIAALPGTATILIVTRRQDEHLRSLYHQYVKVGGTARFEEVIAENTGGPRIDHRYICFDRLVARHMDLFGAEAVIVEPFETLVADTQGAINRILARLDLPPTTISPVPNANPSLDAFGVAVQRRYNDLFAASAYSPNPKITHLMHAQRAAAVIGRILPSTRRPSSFSDQIPKRMLEDFAESNRRLDEMLGGTLAGLGYPGVDA
ncbi:MAG: hypothetical protein RIE08_07305 [Acidimicrobiales bacterium]